MATATTRIRAGNPAVWHPVQEFCKENFGPGGVQRGRRWFARLITPVTIPVTIEAYHDPVADHTEDYTAVYFRDPADAVWFRLKFGADNGHV